MSTDIVLVHEVFLEMDGQQNKQQTPFQEGPFPPALKLEGGLRSFQPLVLVQILAGGNICA